ncbi:TrpB-like pyridoxal phosphate-dependent enzyme [Magnetospirillum molischianum]|uniref:Tryptophan synthase beta chain n=1 Tax=Magnetospirillum molischianum DSM 120 TaxID=1150626 RepID=H8FWX9_MAGML|nr:TrpB-like pyridoxal phosphate-dependent enzyme [Magnetospirillum molischianum]CCG42867.1 Tryptophan synthase beta chain 2 [Magnetospirillum molischianum DSM 120]
MSETVKYLLSEDRIPKAWYNLAADLPVPLPPPLHPGTGQVIGPDDLAPIFPKAVIEQEVSTERWIDIPEPVRDVYRLWRPAPLIRARALEKALDTPAKLYFKYEGVSPAGSHKPNTAVPQAFYNKQEGITRLSTETGAGQWGSSLAFAGSLFGIEVEVYMVKVSYQQKPYRRALMETYGATCIASPSNLTQAGRDILAKDPNSNGSLGIAISEAVEVAASRSDTNYALGSVLNHVCLHQTIIGEEAILQMEMAGDQPDIVIACTGGGSNFAGLAFPYIREKIKGSKVRIIGVEPASCPTLTRGRYAYDYGDTGRLTPMVKMHTLGSTFMPPGSHSGGLRYHGMAPMVSHVKELGLMEARAYHQTECFAAAARFARAEGIVPAPESSHAIKGAIDEALRCKVEGRAETILFNLSGHGHFDMQAYTDHFSGKLIDPTFNQSALDIALSELPNVG